MSYSYDKIYIRPWGSSGSYSEFKYSPVSGGTNSLPIHTRGANDVDLDAFTNTKGYTIRNRVRHDTANLEFDVPQMTGDELHTFFTNTTNVWLDVYFFYEPSWAFVQKKMYRSATVTWDDYYIHPTDPTKNIYQNIKFSFVEE